VSYVIDWISVTGIHRDTHTHNVLQQNYMSTTTTIMTKACPSVCPIHLSDFNTSAEKCQRR